jgi:hypothetical protein
VNTTAAVPAPGVSLVDVEMIVPGDGRTFFEGDVIHFITQDATAFFGVSFYAKD